MNVVSRLLASVALTGLIAGCTSTAGEQVPSTNGIGPITFAIGSDDIAWLTPGITKGGKENPRQEGTPPPPPQAPHGPRDHLAPDLRAQNPVDDAHHMQVRWPA